jgi:hypothetical protein
MTEYRLVVYGHKYQQTLFTKQKFYEIRLLMSVEVYRKKRELSTYSKDLDECGRDPSQTLSKDAGK